MRASLSVSPSKDLTARIRDGLVMAALMGMDHAGNDLELADEDPPEPLPFKEAVSFLKDRVSIPKRAFSKLEDQLRFRAFTVARLAQKDAVKAVQNQLGEALKEGKSFGQFWEETGQDTLLQKAGFHKSNPWYWETVFRTNVQTSYNAGRAMQFKTNPPKELEFIGIVDSRQSAICRARSGVRRPYGDPWWSANWPPLHFVCRSTVRGVYAAEAKILPVPLTAEDALKELPSAQRGFGGNPLVAGSHYKLTVEMKERIREHGIEKEITGIEKKLLSKKDRSSF